MCVSAWVAARYNARRNYPSSAAQDRVRFTLFTSIWTVVFSVVYIVLFLYRVDNMFVSVASHAGLYVFLVIFNPLFKLTHPDSLFVTWVLWLAAAASMTTALGGSLDCSSETYFLYCGQLNAIEAFAWLMWYVPYLLVSIITWLLNSGSW